jgi:hypothetical protein
MQYFVYFWLSLKTDSRKIASRFANSTLLVFIYISVKFGF